MTSLNNQWVEKNIKSMRARIYILFALMAFFQGVYHFIHKQGIKTRTEAVKYMVLADSISMDLISSNVVSINECLTMVSEDREYMARIIYIINDQVDALIDLRKEIMALKEWKDTNDFVILTEPEYDPYYPWDPFDPWEPYIPLVPWDSIDTDSILFFEDTIDIRFDTLAVDSVISFYSDVNISFDKTKHADTIWVNANTIVFMGDVQINGRRPRTKKIK